jgi:hypothetical protein
VLKTAGELARQLIECRSQTDVLKSDQWHLNLEARSGLSQKENVMPDNIIPSNVSSRTIYIVHQAID